MPSSLAATCDLSPRKGSGMESVLGPSPRCSHLVATSSYTAKPAGKGTGWDRLGDGSISGGDSPCLPGAPEGGALRAQRSPGEGLSGRQLEGPMAGGGGGRPGAVGRDSGWGQGHLWPERWPDPVPVSLATYLGSQPISRVAVQVRFLRNESFLAAERMESTSGPKWCVAEVACPLPTGGASPHPAPCRASGAAMGPQGDGKCVHRGRIHALPKPGTTL
ncbi:uncharacterized protein LOC125089780 [Lutra lutra]|uniref:uncharacterized protein LOC125089780 n=1 Tax=Lutra lutra TaxID=9657 RepID=UPI001FD193B4|nr:uncharacterized protein LOC125089780 [Lutra lutra]